MNKSRSAIISAILAASLYALNTPLSKLLLHDTSPAMMAAFLYLGAGSGMLIMGFIRKGIHARSSEVHLTKKDLPYTLWMIVLDILAPIF